MVNQKPQVFIRADGSSKVGLGHVIRSIALAEILMDDFDCTFIIRKPNETLKFQILQVCKHILELEETEDLEKEAALLASKYFNETTIVVLDGYHFKTNYQQFVKRTGAKLVCIDDIHSYHFVADVIINSAGGTKSEFYSKENYTRLYLGLEYVLLRKAFREAARGIKKESEEKSIFICLGGADPDNQIMEVLNKIELLTIQRKLYIVTGSAYQYEKELVLYLQSSGLNYQLLHNLSAEQMVNYMCKCPVAITSPSGISYEYLCVGGVLYLYMIADNQKQMHHFLTSNKLAMDFILFEQPVNEVAWRQRISTHFDGGQKERFLSIFKSLIKG